MAQSEDERYRQHLRDTGQEDDPALRRAWEEEDARNRQAQEPPGGRGWEDNLQRSRDEWEQATRRTGEWDRWSADEREREFAQHAQRQGYGSAQDLQDYLSGRPPGQEKGTYDDLMGRIADARAARDGGLYQVKPGDTLSQIAQRFGLDVEDLLKWNPRPDRNLLRVGEVITLPAYRAAKTPPVAPTAIPQGGLLGRPPTGAPAGHWQDEAIPMPPMGSAEWLRWAAGPKTRRVWKENEPTPTMARGNLDWLRRRLMPETPAVPPGRSFGEDLAPIGAPGASENDFAQQMQRMFTGQIAPESLSPLQEGQEPDFGEFLGQQGRNIGDWLGELGGETEEIERALDQWIRRGGARGEGELRTAWPLAAGLAALSEYWEKLGEPFVTGMAATPKALADVLGATIRGEPVPTTKEAMEAAREWWRGGGAGQWPTPLLWEGKPITVDPKLVAEFILDPANIIPGAKPASIAAQRALRGASAVERAAARGGRAAVEAAEALAPGAKRLAAGEAGALKLPFNRQWAALSQEEKIALTKQAGFADERAAYKTWAKLSKDERQGITEALTQPKIPTDIQVGDWIRDNTGLPVRGQVVGEGTLGTQNIPAWKVDMGGGRISAMPKDTSELWSRAEAKLLPGQAALPEAVAAKEPWQMTQDEFIPAILKRRTKSVEVQALRDRTEIMHRRAVEQALSEGKPVPPEVLADYPDLVAKAAPTKALPEVSPIAAPGKPVPINEAIQGQLDKVNATTNPIDKVFENETLKLLRAAKRAGNTEVPPEFFTAGNKGEVWLSKKQRLAREQAAMPEQILPETEAIDLTGRTILEPPPSAITPEGLVPERAEVPPSPPPGGVPPKPPILRLPPPGGGPGAPPPPPSPVTVLSTPASRGRLVPIPHTADVIERTMFPPSKGPSLTQRAKAVLGEVERGVATFFGAPGTPGATSQIIKWLDPRAAANDALARALYVYDLLRQFSSNAPAEAMSHLRRLDLSVLKYDHEGFLQGITPKTPGGSLLWGDVFDNPSAYNLTSEQGNIIRIYHQILEEARDFAKARNVPFELLDLPPGRHYVPRQSVDWPGAEEALKQKALSGRGGAVGAPKTFQKPRYYDLNIDGYKDGVRYRASPWDVLEGHLQQVYTAASHQALKNMVAPLTEKTGMKVGAPAFKGMFFPKDVGERLMAKLEDQLPAWLKWGTGANQNWRYLRANFDFSAPFIQGMPLLLRNPALWAKATGRHYMAFLNPRVQQEFLSSAFDDVEWLLQHNVPIGRSSFYGMTEGTPWADKIPVIGAWSRRANEAFGTMITDGAIYKKRALYDTYKASGKPNWEDELAEHIRNSLGMGLSAGMSAPQRAAETWTLFASSMYRATLGLFLDTARRGVAGDEARKTMTALLAGGTSVYVGTSLMMGQQPKLDVRKTDAYTVEINGQRIGIGGPVVGLMRAIGQIIAYGVLEPTGVIQPVPGRKVDPVGNVLNVLTRWARSHTSLPAGVAIDLIEGKTYLRDPLRDSKGWNGGNLLRWGIGQFLPFSFSQLAREDISFGEEFGELPLQIQGLRAFPVSNSEIRNRLRSQYAQAEFGVEWPELNRNRRQALLEKYPDLKDVTDRTYVYWKRRADPEEVARSDRLEAYYGGSEPIYRKYEDLLRAVPIGDDTGRRKLYDQRQKELDALTKRIGLKDEDFGGRPLYESPTVSEGKMDEPFNANERVMFRSWADAYYGITEQFKDKNGVVDWDKAEAAQEQFKASKGDILPRFEQYLDRNLTPKDMVERVYKDYIEAYYANPKELRQTWLQSNPVPSWKAIGAEITRRWGYKFTWEPFDVDHPDRYSWDELNDALANIPIPGLEEYQKRSNEDRVNALREFGERFYATSGIVVSKDNVEEYLQATKWFDDNQVALDAWKGSKSLRDYRDSLYAQRNALRATRNQVVDNPDLSVEERQQAYEDEKVQREIINARLAQVRVQIPTYLPWPDVVAKYFSTSPSISDREEARGQQEPLAREAPVSRGVSNDQQIFQIFETMPTTEKGATSEEISAWWDANTPRLKELGYRQEPFKEEIGRLFDAMPDFGEKPTKEQRAILSKWWDDNKPRLIELGWTPKWESQVLELAREWWDARRARGETTTDIDALATHLEGLGMGDKESLQTYIVGPGADNLEKAFIWSEYYGLQAAGKKDEASQYFQAKKSRLKELGWKSTPEQDEIDQIFEEYGRRKAENKKDAYNWLESMKPRLAELGYVFKNGEQPPSGQAPQTGEITSTATSEWWDAFTTEGTPEWRAEFEAVHNRPPNNIDYFRDYLWSLDFQRSKGRGPSRAEWERHYWQDVRQGRPRSRTPEFAPSGNGNRTLTNAQWDSVQDLLGRSGTYELIGSRFDSDRMSADARNTLLRYYRDHPYGARSFNDWLLMARNAYRREDLVPA